MATSTGTFKQIDTVDPLRGRDPHGGLIEYHEPRTDSEICADYAKSLGVPIDHISVGPPPGRTASSSSL